MRSAHTVAQVRAAEAALLATLPDGTLMQRAATGLGHAVLELLGGGYGKRVLLLVGSGDNGGDALYAGALLARRGARVEALLLSDHPHEGGLAALLSAGGGIVLDDVVGHAPRGRASRPGAPHRPDVVIDGIVGIGGRGPLRPEAVAALERVAGVPMVAVDLPSGIDADTGEVSGPHVEATLTVTFGTHKVAHLVDPAARACGAVELVDIGLDLPAAPVEALQAADVARLLPRPAADAHKYTRGVVGVRAGSERYPGAALLSVGGAACGLAGMVRYVGSAATTVKQQHPEVVGEGRVQAWVVGSGTDADAGAHLEAALADGVPLVVDADALAHLARPVPHAGLVLTPHAGELAALLDVDRDEVEARPLHHARTAAVEFRNVVLLKGRRTIVAAPDGSTRVNTTGTPWLATAGAGDVLGGLVGALLAAGLAPYDAASVGAWLHGAAATAASGGGPIVAGDIARHLRAVLRDVITG
jgi:ADP-dependent NAD(P)H-hydrate dehydratase / NAD(P)H-hydrate epimerase